ncbi:hypothetical protein M885DRAFT_276923 [Pelagophyceae sp. CCMP2097]|nr:hypothetical protein M885DRAFT_276923 [Pelagophyceae sp. CCMP2097]
MSRSPSCPNWYDQNAHLQERRKMITNIARLLQARKPNAPVEWMQKLPQMARRLEESLFRSAHSFDEYKDTATLKKRLQALAMAMGLRAQQQQAQQQAATADGAAAAAAAPGNTFAPIAPPPVQAGGGDAAAGAPTPATAHAPDVPGAPPAKRLVSLSEINPLLSPSPLPAAVEAETASPMPGAGVAFEAPPRPELAAEAAPAQNGHAAPAAAGGAAAHAAAAAASQRPYHADQRQQVLRQQQQRLLLLRHASKCPHDGGSCPVTPHCNGMKRLWKHIAECKDQQCQVAHCVSSRYVLSHYHRCKDARCAVCGPVREAIQRNHEKAKQVALQQHASNGGAPSAAPSARVVADPRAAQHASAAATQPQRAPSQRGAPPPPQQPPGRRGLAAGGRDAHGHESKKMRPSEDARPAEARAVAPGRIEEGTSLLNSFSPSQIHAHLQSLKQGLRLSAVKIRAKCGPVLKRLLDHDCAWIFLQPVDAVSLRCNGRLRFQGGPLRRI